MKKSDIERLWLRDELYDAKLNLKLAQRRYEYVQRKYERFARANEKRAARGRSK